MQHWLILVQAATNALAFVTALITLVTIIRKRRQ
jgi:hypothetical protein